MSYEDTVDDILLFFHSVPDEYSRLTSELNEFNAKILDILHFLEIESCGAVEMAKCAKAIKELRKKRREVKDLLEELAPIVNFLNAGRTKSFMNDLSGVLGKVRSVKKNQNSRSYFIRTDILDQFLDEDGLKTHRLESGIG